MKESEFLAAAVVVTNAILLPRDITDAIVLPRLIEQRLPDSITLRNKSLRLAIRPTVGPRPTCEIAEACFPTPPYIGRRLLVSKSRLHSTRVSQTRIRDPSPTMERLPLPFTS